MGSQRRRPGRRRVVPGSGAAALLLALSCCGPLAAQAPAPHLPSLLQAGPDGMRRYVTESAWAVGLRLRNPTTEDVQLRVLSHYPDAPDRQYGRDFWVPAQATLWSWFGIGPPPRIPEYSPIEFRSLLYLRTRDEDRLLRSSEGQPTQFELAPFRRREPATALLLDAAVDDTGSAVSPRQRARLQEVRDLARVFRVCLGTSDYVSVVTPRLLPPTAEEFDGLDHVLLASDWIAEDIAGQDALRGWVQRGGILWVLLDRVQPATVAAVLGDAVELEIVGRGSLTDLHVKNGPANATHFTPVPWQAEDPVEFVRAVVPGQAVLHTLDGWPASSLLEVGRGRVVFTMLGPRGWFRPRGPRDPRPPPPPQPVRGPVPLFPDYPPIARPPLQALALAFQPDPDRLAFTDNTLQPYAIKQIGYAVVGRGRVLLVFAAVFLGLGTAVVALSRGGWLEHLGWLGPALALGAVATLIVLGERARHAVPPTVAVAQVATAAGDEVDLHGLVAAYQPASTDTPVGTRGGGQLELDTRGLEGRVLRRIQTDLDQWHWENLELPAGVRTASFRYTARAQEPITASARFGPDGVTGRLAAGPFRNLGDALVHTPASGQLAVQLEADGSFRAGSADLLPPGQFVRGGLLGDRQQDRQVLYGQFLAAPQPRYLMSQPLLLAWADSLEVPFTLVPHGRQLGAALLAVPLRFERTAPGTAVTIPGPFLECRRDNGVPVRDLKGSDYGIRVRLLFQVPEAVLPLRVEDARLTLKLAAPSREVVVAAFAGDQPVAVRRLHSPVGLEQVEIGDERLLRLDELGRLAVYLTVSEMPAGPRPRSRTGSVAWSVDSLNLDLQGRTLGPSD